MQLDWIEEELHTVLMNWGNQPVRKKRYLREPDKILLRTGGRTSLNLEDLIRSPQHEILGKWWCMNNENPTTHEVFLLGEKIIADHYCDVCIDKKWCEIHGENETEYISHELWIQKLNEEIRYLNMIDD